MHRSLWVSAWGLVLVVAIGCSEELTTAVDEAAEKSPKARVLAIPGTAAQNSVAVGPMTWDVPEGWTQQSPSSSMRQAQFGVAGSAGNGECVVFYFGPGQGGDSIANAERWAGQFSQTDGSSSVSKMKVEKVDGGSLPLLLVEVTGVYDGGMSMGTAPAEAQPGFMLLGGIAEGPDAPWFFKFTGPEATVRENREAFVSLLRSIRQEI